MGKGPTNEVMALDDAAFVSHLRMRVREVNLLESLRDGRILSAASPDAPPPPATSPESPESSGWIVPSDCPPVSLPSLAVLLAAVGVVGVALIVLAFLWPALRDGIIGGFIGGLVGSLFILLLYHLISSFRTYKVR